MSSSVIKNIVFDMGGVLFYDNAMDFAVRYVADQADRELLNRELFHSSEWKNGWDGGTMTNAEVAESVCKRLPQRLHTPVRQIMDNWNMDPRAVPGMEHLIRSLKKSGWGIYLLSNTAVQYYQYRDKLPAIDCFDGEFISADYHLLKPNREIYEKFTGVFGLVPQECYFIDDRKENVDGAVAAGWGGGFVFTGDVTVLEDTIRSLELWQKN